MHVPKRGPHVLVFTNALHKAFVFLDMEGGDAVKIIPARVLARMLLLTLDICPNTSIVREIAQNTQS